MGEAKRRGSFDERKAAAIAAQEERKNNQRHELPRPRGKMLTTVAMLAALSTLFLCVSFAFGRTSVVDDCRDYSAAVIGTIRLDCKVSNNG